MKRNKKYCVSIICSLSILLSSAFSTTVFADNITPNMSNETRTLVDKAINSSESSSDYINSILNDLSNVTDISEEEYNRILQEAANSAITLDEKANEEIAAIELQMQKNSQQSTREEDKESRTSPIDLAKTAYQAGASLAALKGAPQTSAYMLHAMEAHPSKIYHIGDNWAIGAVFNDEFQGVITQRFENEILSQGRNQGTITGGFSYTLANSSLDYYTALHDVDYSVTFIKQSNGYYVSYKITDYFDFDWGTYDSIEVGFGNNYCTLMQSLGLIHPFHIEITYHQ